MKQLPCVLIVEDKFRLYNDLRRSFEAKGFDVLAIGPYQAVDSYEAVAALVEAGARPDLAVLDIQLIGDQTGFDVGRYLQALFYIPIIYLTDLKGDNYVDKAASLNAQFLNKPNALVGDKEPLWIAVRLVKDQIDTARNAKEKGRELPLKIVNVDTKKTFRTEKGYAEDIPQPIIIQWQDVLYIRSCNPALWPTNKNEIVLYAKDKPKGWLCRTTLTELAKDLPRFFVRFSRSEIVNAHFIKPIPGRQFEFKIEGETHEIKDEYRQSALGKLQLLGLPKRL